MNVFHAEYEENNLGVDTWELTPEPGDTMETLSREEKKLIAQGARYLVLKAPVNDAGWLFGLPKLGYSFVETVFHVAIRRADYHIPPEIARFDRGLTVVERTDEANRERIYTLIRSGIFKSDRVSIDPAFTPAQSGERYANWLRQMLAGGGFLYEVLQGERPIGFFVVTRVDEHTVDPVLMGLYDEAHDRGMGALLHKKTLDTCFTHPCSRLTSTIVSNNAKVLRVYVNAGATITDTLYTYVKHL
ncbi:MAG: hypothetical protein PHY64_12465 [Eubacteriales bacterium]|nr:hypothetical protein [Eubacteriales bacterium]